jgi:hypothetical protein
MSAIPPLKDLLDLPELGKSLKKKRCVLMLGPRIATVVENGNDVPIMEGLSLEFARRLDALNIPYEKSAARNLPYVSQMFLREQNIQKDDLRRIAKTYIEEKSGPEDYIPAIYTELANLPVRVIVNTTPDNFIERALRKAGKNPGIFNFNYEVNTGSERNAPQTVVNFDSVGVMQPLVFNMFGSTLDPDSMVITEGDQVTFVRNVLEGRSRLPQEVLNLFQTDSTYLFFGFNLENWQFRLLLKSMQLHEKNRTLSPQTDNYPITEITKTYLKHEFNFHFVDARMDDFAREISKLASSSDAENVYISYADVEEDQKEVDKLLMSFKLLNRINPRLRIWHRGLITSGDVEKQVAEEIEKANIIIPLFSNAYLNDDRIFTTEIPLIENRFNQGIAEVAPVILKPCLWDALPFFQHEDIVRLPDNNLKTLIGGDLSEDEAFRSVAAAFKKRFL